MIAVTGAAIVLSWFPGLRYGFRRSLASLLRRKRIRAGCELAVVGPSFTMSQIARSCASVTSPERLLWVRALRKITSRHSSLIIVVPTVGVEGAAIVAGAGRARARRRTAARGARRPAWQWGAKRLRSDALARGPRNLEGPSLVTVSSRF